MPSSPIPSMRTCGTAAMNTVRLSLSATASGSAPMPSSTRALPLATTSSSATPQFIDVRASAATVPGAHVTVSLPESSVALAAVLGYLLPALGLLFGALVAGVFFFGDLPAVLGAVLGLVAGLIVVRLSSKRFSGSVMTPAVCPSTLLSGDPS